MKNLKIRTKLTLLVSALLVIISFVGIKGIMDLKKADAFLETMYKDRVIPLEQLKNVSDAYAVQIVDVTHKAYHGIITFEQAEKELKEATKIVSENWKAFEGSLIEGKEKELMQEAIALRNTSKATYAKIVDVVTQGKSPETVAMLEEIIRNDLYRDIDPYTEKIAELISIQLDISKNLNDTSDQELQKITAQNIFLIIFAVFLGILLSFYLVRGINRSLKRANTAVKSLADGDLTVKIKQQNDDEIGTLVKNIDRMADKLRQIVSSVIQGAENIASASQQLSSTSQQVSQGASEQASSVEEVSSSMEEMASNIQQNTENSQQTEQIALKSAEGIDASNKATGTAVNSMNEIAEKILIINDIAFQTNILALNAAVEAARAGEHGKGFAVVAAEVRKLAERSKVAAEEIDNLSKGGVQDSERAGVMLSELVPEIEKTSRLLQEITAASLEQNSGADQINNAIQQLNNVTQQNAAASEEMATSSEELAGQADQLKEQMLFFKVA